MFHKTAQAEKHSSRTAPHTVIDLLRWSNTLSCFAVGVLLSSSHVGHLDRYKKSKTKSHILIRREWQTEVQRRCDKPGPLDKKQSKEAKGSGNTVEDVSKERRTTAKERRRQKASFVRVFKIHLGKQAIHLPRLILNLSGFDSGPTSGVSMQPVELGNLMPPPGPACFDLHLSLPTCPFSLAKALVLEPRPSSDHRMSLALRRFPSLRALQYWCPTPSSKPGQP